jgi:surface polysaccharide O-acyltransferase-like enzyme
LTRLPSSASWLYKGALLFGIGLSAQALETYLLWIGFGAFPYPDFTLGTYLMGVGFSMVALSNHPLLQVERLSVVGQYTLGIYAIHFVYVDMFRGARSYWAAPASEVAYLFAVFIFSVGTALLMGKVPILRKLVA